MLPLLRPIGHGMRRFGMTKALALIGFAIILHYGWPKIADWLYPVIPVPHAIIYTAPSLGIPLNGAAVPEHFEPFIKPDSVNLQFESGKPSD